MLQSNSKTNIQVKLKIRVYYFYGNLKISFRVKKILFSKTPIKMKRMYYYISNKKNSLNPIKQPEDGE